MGDFGQGAQDKSSLKQHSGKFAFLFTQACNDIVQFPQCSDK